jgi:hypothetical protein
VKLRWQSIHQEENNDKVSDQATQRQKASARSMRQSIRRWGHHVHNEAQATLAAKYQPKQQRRQSIHKKRSDDKSSAEKSASSQVSAAKKQTTMATSNLQVGHTRAKKELKHM